MKLRVLVLGAGFGGLELSSILSEAIGDHLDLTLIDKNDSFFFGYSKLDVMFGRTTSDAVRIAYSNIVKPGVEFRQETITAIDPETRRVTTDGGTYDADVLVIALGADYAPEGTPGLVEGGYEFYSFAGAERLREVIPTFSKGHAIVGATSTPFKCTPATSKALLRAFKERGITYVPDRLVRALDPQRRVALLDDKSEMPYDLFLGIPKHRVPEVVAASGMTEEGWVTVDPKTLKTRFPNVYAIGDVTSVGTAKAGVFAETAARVAAASIIAEQQGSEGPSAYKGDGICYVEFGEELVGRVDVDFLSGPEPTGSFTEPSLEITGEKQDFGSSRRARWFGL
jgi:sulfide:quinone oxidoreductase